MGSDSVGFDEIPPELNELTRQILGAAIEVHRHLGPGLAESVYETALEHELGLLRMHIQRQEPITVPYKDIRIGGQQIDLIVDGRVIVELKTVSALLPVHEAQLLSYLRSTGLRVGLLINFNAGRLMNGVRRIVL